VTDEMFGPYRLERLLGRGGTGEVWQATDTVRGRSVALTRLPVGWAADPEFRARFRSEAAAAARLHEPHIVPIRDHGEIDGRLFVATQPVEGADLATLLAEDGPLTPADAVDVTTQVAAALDAAHAAGAVHRDIRPANLLVTTDDGFVHVSDFGVAGSLRGGGASLTAAGTTVDSLQYMAPEWLLHGGGDHRVDVYALGCVLYEALTARKPFPAERLTTLIQAHLNAPPPRASQYGPDVPAALDEVIATALAKDPDHRYRSAGDLAAAARAALEPAAVGSAATLGMPWAPGRTGDDLADAPTVPGLRLPPPPPPDPVPAGPGPADRTGGRRRFALAGVVVLLLAAGLGIVSFDQTRTTGVAAPAGTTAASAAPTPPPAAPGPVELRLVGHTGTVSAVTTAQLNGRPVAVSGSWDKTLRVWDLATGTPVGAPFTGHTNLVLGVATAQLDGRPVAISAGKDNTVRVWDLATGAPVGTPFTGHTDTVFAVAAAQLDGRPVVVSASADHTVRVSDLATGAPVGTPLTGHTSHVFALTVAQLNGRPVVVTASADRTLRVWDLATGAPVGNPLTGHTDYVTAVTTARLDGRPVVISGSADRTVRVWDLATGAPVGTPFTGHTDQVTAVATAQLSGRTVVLSSSLDGTVRVWDLATGAPVGTPFTGHTGGVWTVATTELNGRPVVLSGSADQTVRVWDLAAQAHS
jgi:WD40 repeat protein